RVSRVDTGGLALLLHVIQLGKKQRNNVTLQGVNDKVYTLAKLYNLPAHVLPR
ncbi:phospholipid ABC transporter substrate-binding protein, partial [Escherichia coli]